MPRTVSNRLFQESRTATYHRAIRRYLKPHGFEPIERNVLFGPYAVPHALPSLVFTINGIELVLMVRSVPHVLQAYEQHVLDHCGWLLQRGISDLKPLLITLRAFRDR